VKTTLSDDQRSVRVEVAQEPSGLALYPAGYGLCACADGTAGPVLLELHEGRLRLVVWDDINLEEPSHVIDLEGAREDHRRASAGRGVRRLISSATSR
jgi:hypothetical protein